jgi:hypothetical protein
MAYPPESNSMKLSKLPMNLHVDSRMGTLIGADSTQISTCLNIPAGMLVAMLSVRRPASCAFMQSTLGRSSEPVFFGRPGIFQASI